MQRAPTVACHWRGHPLRFERLLDSPRNASPRIAVESGAFFRPSGYRAANALDKSNADYQGAAIPRPADLALGFGLTALFAASALYGYLAVGDCRDGYTKRGAPLPE